MKTWIGNQAVKTRLRWQWSSFLESYRAIVSGYALSVYRPNVGPLNAPWSVEIDRSYLREDTTNVLRHHGCKTEHAAMRWAERRLLQFARTETNRMARIMRKLGAS